MFSSFVVNPVACTPVPRSPRYQPKSFRTDTDRIEQSACHRSTSASTSAWRAAVERERQAHGTQNEQMWFLVIQPFLSFYLVGTLPQIPSQPLRAPRPPLGRAVVNHRSWIGLCTSTHHLLHDQHLLRCVSSTLLGHPSARPEPHPVSVALELLLVPTHLHQVLSLHHAANFSDTLLSSVPLPSSVLAISASSRVRHPSECP